VNASTRFLNPSEAARRLGISAKALRIYEQRGLVTPVRNAVGWRAYGPREMGRAAEIVALRILGLSLAQVARVLGGNPQELAPALADHQAILEVRMRELVGIMERVRCLRVNLARGQAPAVGELEDLLVPAAAFTVAFDLPWPWGGEHFELRDIRSLNYIVGPLGSGKTRLAKRLAEALPDAAFLGLERLADGGASARARMGADPALTARIDQTLTWLVEDGATVSDALVVLLVSLESDDSAILVVDMVEQQLEQATQEALIAHLRHRQVRRGRPLFLLTRSSAILDLAAVGADETIILCPANHNPPTSVAPYPGAPGYEAVATCLASPEVRARTQGTIAYRPQMA
jgi:DNA-binding transcriptional MerR regulator